MTETIELSLVADLVARLRVATDAQTACDLANEADDLIDKMRPDDARRMVVEVGRAIAQLNARLTRDRALRLVERLRADSCEAIAAALRRFA